jgi:hypothetical protein
MEAKTRRMRTHRARPAIESLEGRQLLSVGASHHAAAEPAASSGGVLSAKGQVFSYVTLTGGIAKLRIVGVGTLAGTSVDSSGNLDIVYGGTNVFSKIVGTVSGGGGVAPLASIRNAQLIDAGQPNSLSGVGGTPLAAVLMSPFDLVPGGSIILTPGVTSLVLHSIGANTDIQLRTLPPAPSYRILPANAGNTAGGNSALFGVLATSVSTGSTSSSAVLLPVAGGAPASGLSPITTTTGTTLIPAVTGNSSLASAGAGASSGTLEAGQSASITSSQGVTLSYTSDGGRSQVLSNISGSFTAQPNLLEPLAPGQALAEPPAPPGIILKANTIGGTPTNINPLTAKIFGYDQTAGTVDRFVLNLKSDTATFDNSFAPIPVPGDPPIAGVDVTQVGNQLLLLVASGMTVTAYDAQTGALAGRFTTAIPVDAIATAGNITVLGNTEAFATNTTVQQLDMIDLADSLKDGHAVGLGEPPPTFIPQSDVILLGGLTGLPGSNNLYATVGAHFSTLQPDRYQLGVETIGTTLVSASPAGTQVFNQFSVIARNGLVTNGTYAEIQVNPAMPSQVPALGAVDQNLALDSWDGKKNTIKLYSPSSLTPKGTISVKNSNNQDFTDPLTSLSGTFRTGLGSAAVIDVQGNVQSIRSQSANGMFLNDTGNLATVKIQRIDNSTIVGQPLSHIVSTQRNTATILTSAREVGNRNGAMQVQNIQPIGPLSPANSS